VVLLRPAFPEALEGHARRRCRGNRGRLAHGRIGTAIFGERDYGQALAGWSLPLAPNMGSPYNLAVRVIAKRTLRESWKDHPDAKEPLLAWHQEVLRAKWSNPHEIKVQYRNASVLQGGRVVFNIAGNKHRLVAKINYSYGIVYVRFIGTHRQCDQIDVEAV
jgi:mRNA interferase HigB